MGVTAVTSCPPIGGEQNGGSVNLQKLMFGDGSGFDWAMSQVATELRNHKVRSDPQYMRLVDEERMGPWPARHRRSSHRRPRNWIIRTPGTAAALAIARCCIFSNHVHTARTAPMYVDKRLNSDATQRA